VDNSCAHGSGRRGREFKSPPPDEGKHAGQRRFSTLPDPRLAAGAEVSIPRLSRGRTTAHGTQRSSEGRSGTSRPRPLHGEPGRSWGARVAVGRTLGPAKASPQCPTGIWDGPWARHRPTPRGHVPCDYVRSIWDGRRPLDRHFFAKSIAYGTIAERGSLSSQLRRSGAKRSRARSS
jgi:hypothetical protein